MTVPLVWFVSVSKNPSDAPAGEGVIPPEASRRPPRLRLTPRAGPGRRRRPGSEDTRDSDLRTSLTRYRMNRILSVVRSMTDKIIELSRAVVTAPAYGESNGGLESIRSTY